MLKLDTKIDIKAFWDWWTHELATLLPASMLDGFHQGNSLLVVEPQQDRLQLSYQLNSRHQVEPVFLGEFDSSDASKVQLQTLFDKETTYAEAEVVLRIPESLGMQKIINLPDVAGTNLDQMLAYELDRYTPFNASQIYYTYVKLGSAVNGQLSVALLMVQKPVLDALYEQLLALGLKPGYADCAQRPLNSLPVKERYNLLPLSMRRIKSNKPRLIMYAAFTVMLLLLFTLFAQPLWMAYQGIDKLKVHQRKIESLAIQVDDTKKGIDHLYKATNTLIAKKQNNPPLVEIVNILSKELKNDTWLSQLRYSNAGLELLGEAANTSTLISVLEKTGRFKNTRFISPVTQDRNSGKERFQIATDIIPVNANAAEPK